jgi:hypothetical protein
VAHDGKATEPEPGHELGELGGHLALAVALAEGTAGRGATLAAALEIADHYGVPLAERRGHEVPAEVGLRKAV